MTNVLHIPSQPGAPIACDMSTASDTPQQRLQEYERLFERALVRRERKPGAVALSFRADPGIREAVESLARREAACCPFLDQRLEAVGAELVWTLRGPAGAEPIVDAIAEASAQLPGAGATQARSRPSRFAS
jgi:hypothetical protein